MNVEVTVFHRMGEPLFLGYASGDPLAKRYSYGTHLDLATEYKHRERILENVWRENNVVHGREVPATYMTRSMAVGDVFVLDYGVSSGVVEAWCVEGTGFEAVDSDDLRASMWAWDVLKEQPA